MKSIKSAVRNHGRIVSFSLLSLLILTSACIINPAHADGVSGKITNGQPVTGTISKGTDTYTFNVTKGSAFILSVSETGAHVKGFVPEIDLSAPGDVGGRGLGRPLHALLEEFNPAEGMWSVKVHNADKGTAAASYALTLIQVPGTLPRSGGIAGKAMSDGAANSGSTNRGKLEVWTFDGVAGQTKTLTLKHTGHAGIGPEIHVFAPTGDFGGGTGCAASCTQDVPITTSGVYTVVAFKNDASDVTSTYTLSVKNKN